jgi:four helix bundle protein
MNTIKTHRDLDVWKTAMDFAVALYKLTESFPRDEKYGLVSQIRRAGISVCSNIAEGAGRNHSKEFIQFLYMALGSASEIETQLEIATRLGYIKDNTPETETLVRVRKMLVKLIQAIRRKTEGSS